MRSWSAAVALGIALCAALAVAASAGGSPGETAAAPDTTPPDAYIRARKRMDLQYSFRKGIQTTCGTEDDEQPLTCTMSANRKGKVLKEETTTFDRPFNRAHFELELDPKEKYKIRRAEPPIEILLKLAAEDEAGNVDRVRKRVRLVAGLYD